MKVFVVVFYLLVNPGAYVVAPGKTFKPSPQWERVEFPYHTFSDERLCRQWLNDNRVSPPSTVSSIVLCEERRSSMPIKPSSTEPPKLAGSAEPCRHYSFLSMKPDMVWFRGGWTTSDCVPL